MFKKYLGFVVIVSAVLVSGTVLAKTDNSAEQNLPESSGLYNVPGHPNLKLKVIVHHGKPTEKPGKPAPTTPTLACNLPDGDSASVVSPAGWVMPSNWTYRLNPGSVPSSVGGSNLGTIATNAFSPWQNAVGSAVNITKGANTTTARATRDSQNIIAWGRTSGTALATTYIWYDTSTAPYTVVELDTIMNNKFSWAWSDPSAWITSPNTTCAYQSVYDAQDILTHELGHWYGLDDEYESAYENNTMFGYGGTGETHSNTLTSGDIAGVSALY